MKILYYIPHSSFFSLSPYGRVTHAIGVANGLEENGNEVCLVAESGVLNFKKRINAAVKIRTLTPFSKLTHFSFLKERDFINGFDVFLYRKTIFSLFWIVLFRLYFFNRKFKIVSEVNGFIFDYNQKFKNKKLLIAFTEFLHKLLLRNDDLVYVVNDDLKSKLVTGLFPLKAAQVIVVHNGGPNPVATAPVASNNGSVNLVFFGILADYNELDLCIDAVNANAHVKLHIVGFGPQLDNLKDKAEKLSNVFFYGPKTFEEFGVLIKDLDGPCVGLIPMNLGNEKASLSPIKAFDYMSFGLPLIYSNACLDNLVTPGVEGLRYAVGDLQSLKAAINQITNMETYHLLKNGVVNNYLRHTWEARMKILNDALAICVE